MKKLFASIVATLMAASFALPLAACGGGGELVSERLPENNFEEAWKEAFSHLSDENIKIVSMVEGYLSDGEVKYNETYNQTVVRDGDLERWMESEYTAWDSRHGEYFVPASDMIIDFSANPLKGYACGADGVFHACQPDDEGRSLAKYMSMEPYEDDDEPFVTQIRYWGKLHEEQGGKLSDFFHYSKEDKGYVHEEVYDPDDESLGKYKAIVKFKDGKIALYSLESYGNFVEPGGKDDYVIYTWTITYGGQEVHLPFDEECDHGVRAMQSDILPEAGFAEAVEKAFDIYDSENIKIEFGGGGGERFYSGKLIHADKKEYYFECSGNGNRVHYRDDGPSYIEGYCDLRGEAPVGFLQSSDGTRHEWQEVYGNGAMFREGIERVLLFSLSDFSEIKSAPQKLHYSEADKGYVWGDNEYIVKFKNGKISSIYLNDGILSDYSYMIFTYGGQTVTLPDMSAE